AALDRSRQPQKPGSGIVVAFELGAGDARGRHVLVLDTKARRRVTSLTADSRVAEKYCCLFDEVGHVVLEHVGLEAQSIVGHEEAVLSDIDADLAGLADLLPQVG